jgi:hypothetical protein
MSIDTEKATWTTPTSAKRLTPKQTAMKPLIIDLLPPEKPGLSPDEVYDMLKSRSTQEIEGSSSDSLKVHIRSALKNMHDLGEVRRETARGPNGGSSYKYTRPRSSQTDRSPLANTPSLRSASTGGGTHLHDHSIQRDDGSPTSFSPLLWRSGERNQILTPDLGAHEISGNEAVVQDISRPDLLGEMSTEPEAAVDTSDRPGSQQLQERTVAHCEEKTPDSNDMELLRIARGLKIQLEEATNDISTLESRQQQAQSQCFVLESQVKEQESKKAELLVKAQRLREEALEAESQAADCQKRADTLDKEVDGKRKDHDECEVIVVAARKKIIEIAEQLQSIKVELKI